MIMDLMQRNQIKFKTYARPWPPEDSLRPLPLPLEIGPRPLVVLILERHEPAGGGGGGMICSFIHSKDHHAGALKGVATRAGIA